jgi:hypothetical protein
MRWWRGLFVCVSLCASLVACTKVTALDVGALDASVPDAPEIDSSVPTMDAGETPLTLSQILAQRCAAGKGSVDDFNNAAELSQRLRGRWYFCPTPVNWSLPPGSGVDFEFGDGGTFQFLLINDAGTDFSRTSGTDNNGPLLYLVFTGMEGIADGSAADGSNNGANADASTEAFVAWDDPTARFNINLFFDRVQGNLEFVPELTISPRTLTLRELGGTPASAMLVPID